MRCNPIVLMTAFGRTFLRGYCAVVMLLTCVSAHAATTQYYYDDLGRIVQAIGSDGSIRQYQYDENDNLLAINHISASVLTVSGLTPLVGHVGANVTILGTGFSATVAQNEVRFGAISAIVNSATTTRLVVTVPGRSPCPPPATRRPVRPATWCASRRSAASLRRSSIPARRSQCRARI